MPRRHMISMVAAALACMAALPAGANAATRTYECQRPVMTGVEVYGLRRVSVVRACPVALALFAWENASSTHAKALYGCHRPAPDTAGNPFLRLHHFRGWRLSFVGRPYRAFTMSRGRSSFHVGGTDFPLNCT